MAPRLFFLLSTAQRAVQRRTAKSATPGLTASQAGVLFLLGRSEGASIGEVARELEATASAMTELIDRMVAAGLVIRSADPNDGRTQRLTLTAAGQAVRRSAVASLGELNTLMTDGFSGEEIGVVARWLGTVRTRFTTPAGSRP